MTSTGLDTVVATDLDDSKLNAKTSPVETPVIAADAAPMGMTIRPADVAAALED